ncbi:MAG: ABC transporter ATP-binding protein [Ruminococcaceae bacterium]|nr:ABC transporter ATP-binding protein [Oscillospiraceae bacterium]
MNSGRGPASSRNAGAYQPQDKKARSKVLKRIAKYLLEHKLTVIVCFVMMLVSNLLALAAPKLSQSAIDAIEPGVGAVDMRKVVLYCSLMLLFYALSAVMSFLLAITMVRLSQKIVYDMRKQLFDHLLELPVGYFDTHATGEIISRISYDIDTVNASLSHDLLQICASIVTVVGSLVMMISISPVLIVVFAFTVPMSIIYTKHRSSKTRPLFRKRSQKLGELNGYAEEMLSGQKTIKAYNREEVICDRFEKKNEEAVAAYYAAEYHAAVVGPTVNFINNFSLSLVTMLGGIFYLFHIMNETGAASILPIFTITLGGVSAFVQYSRKFAGPINEFANIVSDLQSACAAAEKVFAVMDEPPELPDVKNAEVLSEVEGEVELSGVRFGYNPEKTIIKNLSIKADKGNVIAIVGPTGAGKTTIINLLMRFYDVNGGRITVDGKEIREVTRESLRSAYTMVLQETWLFHGTIFENITYGKEGASREEVEAVAKMARIHNYIESLPDGYDTLLSDDGVNISKGHKQLITIARAMLADAPMLILDEATSNVDSRTEQKIQEAMYKLMEGRTCFVIAHRLSTIQNADNILVVKDGNVIEQGDHEALMRAKGFYYSLYNSQFDS